MIFGSPWWLLAVPLAAGAVLRRVWRRGDRLAVPALGRRRWTLRLAVAWLPWALEVAGLSLLAVALARPQSLVREAHSSHGIDVMIALDVSESMALPDLHGASMFPVARQKARELVASRPHDRIGLVVFGGEAITVLPPTADRRLVLDAIDQYAPGDLGDGTAVGQAIALAAKRLRDLHTPGSAILVVTDGRDNASDIAPAAAIGAAQALGIQVHAVGIDRAPGLRTVRDALGTLERDLGAVGGHLVRVKTAEQLVGGFDALQELVPSPGVGWISVHPVDRYRWFLAPGLVMLGVSTVLSSTWLRRGP
ncbi:MAG: VWA domain-containing protein [Alphaproteobacteria bacterium]|nr:VWA domain-containing protein [Alphaproteobacteria bacterium]